MHYCIALCIPIFGLQVDLIFKYAVLIVTAVALKEMLLKEVPKASVANSQKLDISLLHVVPDC